MQRVGCMSGMTWTFGRLLFKTTDATHRWRNRGSSRLPACAALKGLRSDAHARKGVPKYWRAKKRNPLECLTQVSFQSCPKRRCPGVGQKNLFGPGRSPHQPPRGTMRPGGCLLAPANRGIALRSSPGLLVGRCGHEHISLLDTDGLVVGKHRAWCGRISAVISRGRDEQQQLGFNWGKLVLPSRRRGRPKCEWCRDLRRSGGLGSMAMLRSTGFGGRVGEFKPYE